MFVAAQKRGGAEQDAVDSGIELESLSFPNSGEIMSDLILEQMMVDGWAHTPVHFSPS